MSTHFSDYYDHAKTLNENDSLDLSETPECALCHKQDSKCMLCAACKAVYYCSAECARAGWTDRIIEQGGGTAPGHKIMCQQNNEQMSKVTGVQDVLLQFPWARIEKDGTFIPALVLASRNILGTGKEYGFWSQEPCCDEHGLSSYEVGTTLLQEAHPNEQTGWKLPDEEIPWLAFDEQHKPPRAPPNFEASWKSYYGWRGLPLSSPAALLLHWPLSIYHLLKKLEVISDTEEVPGERRKLLVHYIGVEEELDYLPIFGELALLLPNTDIELVLFGEPAYMILHSAPQVAQSATIVSKSNDDIVYTYSAPVESGSGTIRIVLWGGGPIWTPEVLRFGAPVPDAIVGLNAGLASFQEWQSVIVSSRAFNIPFAITDLMEASLDLDRRLIRGITVDLPDDEDAEEWMKHTYGEKAPMNLRKDHNMVSEMNAFMKPGQRIGGPWSRLPAAVNGFTFIVTPKLASGPDSV